MYYVPDLVHFTLAKQGPAEHRGSAGNPGTDSALLTVAANKALQSIGVPLETLGLTLSCAHCGCLSLLERIRCHRVCLEKVRVSIHPSMVSTEHMSRLYFCIVESS